MEIFKDIPGYEKVYQVSNLGNVKSLTRPGAKEKLLKGEIDQYGYIRISLTKNGKTKKYKAHRLVMMTFNDTTDSSLQINHIDGNKKNNKLENLEWCTASYNTRHSYINNLNKTKGFRTIIKNKQTGEEKEYRSMRDASIGMGYNKGYLFKKINQNIYFNEKYEWRVFQ
jgi:hypothetical protein